MPTISVKMIPSLRDEISALRPRKRDKLTTRELVRALEPEIRASLARGVTIDAIIAVLKQHNFHISTSTLTRHLRALRTLDRTPNSLMKQQETSSFRRTGHELHRSPKA